VSGPAPGADARRRITAVAGGGVLLLSALGGFLLYHLARPRQPALRATTVTVQAPPEPTVAPPEPAGPRIPESLPEIALPAPDGVLHRLSDYRGKLLVVNFWATWCEPCRREMPLLSSLKREHAKDGFEIVGIAIDQRADVAKYVSDHPTGYPILEGEKGGLRAANAFGMDVVLPFSVFADRSGQIITLKVGELHPDEARLILERMLDLDRGRLTAAAAREAIASGIARLGAARARAPTAAEN
jgi:thiol-disulfide isomerase/thioredoxin